MKKFIILSFFLFVIIIYNIYKEVSFNKEIIKDNIIINYPCFNNHNIDNYLDKFINNSLNKYYIGKYDSLFIDYDYNDNTNILILYKYYLKSNIIQENIKTYIIDNNNINIVSNYEDSFYDIYYQNEIDLNKPIVALTFDDGPNNNTSKILDLLNKYNIKATFFILGNRIKGNEEIIKNMDKFGMEIGNHTYSHILLTNLKSEMIVKQIDDTDKLIFDIIGKYPTLFRPSYGAYNNKFKSIVNYPIILWNIDTLDWKYHNSNKISNRVLNKISDGDIILMHDIYTPTYNSLKIFIPKLIEQGYQFVTVSELFYYKNIYLEKGKIYSHIN